MIVTLQRILDDGNSTTGKLSVGDEEFCTLELPWRNNEEGISCIPAGTYECVPHGWEKGSTAKFKRTWLLLGTEPREAILLHAGNTYRDTRGCIVAGMDKALWPAENGRTIRAVVKSQKALDELRRIIGEKRFTLVIKPVMQVYVD